MKRFAPAIIAAILIAGGIWYGRQPVANPDPNHTHADFAIWIYSEKLDFTDARYMSEAYDPNGREIRVDPMRKYLHLHDGNGQVLHRHKLGLTFGDFVRSLGVDMKAEGCIFTPHKEEGICPSYNYQWRFIVNGEDLSVKGDSDDWSDGLGATLERAFAYDFKDGDKILLSLADPKGSVDIGWREWKEMTDDACKYSQTCPWRGPAPTENCIADPEVPCTAP